MYEVTVKQTRPNLDVKLPLEIRAIKGLFNRVEALRVKCPDRLSSEVISGNELEYVRRDMWVSKEAFEGFIAANSALIKQYYDVIAAYNASSGCTSNLLRK